MRVLFVCSQNMLRSPTAEEVFSRVPGLEVTSAGTEDDAEVPVSLDLVEWAEIILVMESYHRKRLLERFGSGIRDKKIVVLAIRDDYERMDLELVKILKERVPRHLGLTPEQMAALG